MDQYPRISIIILNWNGWKDTIECIESIFLNDYPNFHLIIVDNNSTDNSINRIKEYCEGKEEIQSTFFTYSKESKPIKSLEFSIKEIKNLNFNEDLPNYFEIPKNLVILKNDINAGFAQGNNMGIRFSINAFNPDFIILLNNDTVVSKNFIYKMVEASNSLNNIGVIGPKSYHYDNPNLLGCSGGRINFWTGNIVHSYAGQTDVNQFQVLEERDFISGTCMMISAKIPHHMIYLNPEYFFGGIEDVDFCLRIKKFGFKCISTPLAILWHKGESSTVLKNKKNALELYAYYSIRNRLLLYKQNWSRAQLISVLLFFPIVYSIMVFNAIKKGYWSLSHVKQVINGTLSYIREIILNKNYW